MTRDDIIRLAREAGICTWIVPPQEAVERFERFAALVAAAERDKKELLECVALAYQKEAKAYRNLYEKRGKALMSPCVNCGHKPKQIRARGDQ